MPPIGSTALTHRCCLFRFSLRLQRFLWHRLRRSRSTLAFGCKVKKRIRLWWPSCYGVGRGAGVGRDLGVTLGLSVGVGLGVIVGVAVAVGVGVDTASVRTQLY